MENRWGNSGNSDRLYFGGAPKSLQMVIASAIYIYPLLPDSTVHHHATPIGNHWALSWDLCAIHWTDSLATTSHPILILWAFWGSCSYVWTNAYNMRLIDCQLMNYMRQTVWYSSIFIRAHKPRTSLLTVRNIPINCKPLTMTSNLIW